MRIRRTWNGCGKNFRPERTSLGAKFWTYVGKVVQFDLRLLVEVSPGRSEPDPLGADAGNLPADGNGTRDTTVLRGTLLGVIAARNPRRPA